MDRQNYLDAQSKHQKLLKDSIPYSQALRIKRICSSQQEFLHQVTKMINQFKKRGYNRSLIEQQIDKANLQESERLMKEKKKDTDTTIPLSLKYNRTLPKIKEIVMKHWHLLHTTSLKSNQTNRIFKIYHNLNCKSTYVLLSA